MKGTIEESILGEKNDTHFAFQRTVISTTQKVSMACEGKTKEAYLENRKENVRELKELTELYKQQ